MFLFETASLQDVLGEFYAQNQGLLTTLGVAVAALVSVLKSKGYIAKFMAKADGNAGAISTALADVRDLQKSVEANKDKVLAMKEKTEALLNTTKAMVASLSVLCNMLIAITKNSTINLRGLSEITDIALQLQTIQKTMSATDATFSAITHSTDSLVGELKDKTLSEADKANESASSAGVEAPSATDVVSSILGGD